MTDWVDLQVNGYGGVNFSNPGLSIEGIRDCSRLLKLQGTAGYLATVITVSWETYQKTLPVLARSIQLLRSDPECARIIGLHLEGPYISAVDGARGVHSKDLIRPPAIDDFDELMELSQSRIIIVTIAPELPGAIPLIRHAVDRGVIVSLGHTLAETKAINLAVDAGASLSTHLGNGLPLTIHRHMNPLWSQLAQPLLKPMIITDGHHLPEDFIRVVIGIKGFERTIVVSDSSPAAGLPPGEYDFFGVRAILDDRGKLAMPGTGFLAGSSSSLNDCMDFLKRKGFSESECLQLGRDNPTSLLSTAQHVNPLVE